MADISVETVKTETRNIVRQASRDGTLHELTPRIIRQSIEKRLGLEEGLLDAKEYKTAVKLATAEAMEESNIEVEDHKEAVKDITDDERPKKVQKRKSDATSSSSTKKPRTVKADKHVAETKTKAREATSKSKGQRPVRSASVVPSSDEEDGDNTRSSTSKNAPANREVTDENVQMKALALKGSSSERNSPDLDLNDDASGKDIELEDDKPTRVRAKKTKGSDEKPSTGRKRSAKKPSEESPEDQEIKRLKSFVTACGVRKVWSKEFKDILGDKPAQTRRLRAVLADLGMTGRLSMEKAKAVRAKRELAQELEDVQNFEKAVVNGATKSRVPHTRGRPDAVSESEDDVVRGPVKVRRVNARTSIMAFLDDQSDDE